MVVYHKGWLILCHERVTFTAVGDRGFSTNQTLFKSANQNCAKVSRLPATQAHPFHMTQHDTYQRVVSGFETSTTTPLVPNARHSPSSTDFCKLGNPLGSLLASTGSVSPAIRALQQFSRRRFALRSTNEALILDALSDIFARPNSWL